MEIVTKTGAAWMTSIRECVVMSLGFCCDQENPKDNASIIFLKSGRKVDSTMPVGLSQSPHVHPMGPGEMSLRSLQGTHQTPFQRKEL